MNVRYFFNPTAKDIAYAQTRHRDAVTTFERNYGSFAAWQSVGPLAFTSKEQLLNPDRRDTRIAVSREFFACRWLAAREIARVETRLAVLQNASTDFSPRTAAYTWSARLARWYFAAEDTADALLAGTWREKPASSQPG